MAFVKKTDAIPAAHEERKQQRNCPDLVASLEDDNAITRRWAARDMVNCPHVAVALVDRTEREDELSVREIIPQYADPTG